MGADEDVYLAFCHAAVDVVFFACGAEAVEVVDIDGQPLEPVAEGVVVLERQHGVWHQHGHLLGVAAGLEGGTDGHFGLAEAHVAAYKAVHGGRVFHVVFDVLGGFELVGGVLVEEGGFELLLQVAVGTVGIALRRLALGVEGNEVFGYVFDLFFGFLLEYLPGVAAQAVEGGGGAFLAHIAAYLVKAVDADVEGVVVFVDEAYDLLGVAVGGDFL